MIEKLTKTLKSDIGNKFRVEHFNSTLPILLKVLQKTKPNEYLLEVGKRTLKSKSHKELKVGSEYYAVMRNTSAGHMMLTSLKSLPTLSQTPLLLDLKSFEEVLKKAHTEELKEFGIEGMLKAKSKEEFSAFGFFLMGLQKNILSFMLEDKENQRHYLQIKRGRDCLEFFAFYANFGAIIGKVFKKEQKVHLELQVQFESVAEFLRSYQKDLRGIGEIRIGVVSEIKPLFVMQDALLDLKI